jgi:uncharacterized protein (UPF0128 family)
METMDFCRRHNIKGAMVSVDVSKAFDSVDHGYMEKVYQFFGLGPRIRRWLSTIGTGRNAQILLANDELSVAFQLEKGHAQGDAPSPLLYNMAAQICIWKVELDPGIISVYDPVLRANPDPNLAAVQGPDPDRIRSAEVYGNEANRETDKNESFADDANNFTVLSYGSLARLKKILTDFRILSGLSCNVEKTCVMRIGNLDGEVTNDIKDLGFAFVDEMVLLGFKLSNNGNMLSLNFDPVIEKIRSSIRYWERFYLSIPGKIAVYKCLLLSQLSYKASILMPSRETVQMINNLFENFVTNGITYARDRIYRLYREGGLGMIPVEKYIQGLHCSWFKRANVAMNDNWKYDLYRASNGDTINIKAGHTVGEIGSVLTDLVSSYTVFQNKFTQYGNNYLHVPIYCNGNFGYGRNQSILLDNNFFGQENMHQHGKEIRKITWNDCTVNGNFVPIRNFNEHTRLPLTREQYYDLKTAYTKARKKYEKENAIGMDLTEFFGSFKKGSRKFRMILGYEKKTYDLTKLTQVNTFARITNTTVPPVERLKNMHCMWGKSFLCNELRVFLLKYHNNLLGLGNRLAHFVQNVDVRCTFCVLANKQDPVPESFEHVFYSCPVTQALLKKFFEKFITKELTAEIFFSGVGSAGNEKENVPFSLVLDIFRYFIWQCKLNKRLPTLAYISEEVVYMTNSIRKTSKEMCELFDHCTMFTRRDDGRGDGDDQHGRG